ncbi:protein-tyrosine phosphatase [Sphingobium faniae]|nr:protein-tyrosine phosphatase [Sphingobium faniae]
MAASLLPIKGARNLRDMGGLRSLDGRVLRHGMLFRSGSLHEIEAESADALAALGLQTICDFRAPDERLDQPTPLVGDLVEIVSWDDAQDLTHRGLAEGEMRTREDGRRAVMKIYEQLPVLHLEKYRVMFERLVAGKVPMLFHCAAGKDRTGIAAALILEAIGVSRSDILEDYAASEKLVHYLSLFRKDAQRNPRSVVARYLQKPESFVSAVLSSDPAYLDHGLASIADRWGSTEAYLEREMRLDAERKERLRDILLEEAAASKN